MIDVAEAVTGIDPDALRRFFASPRHEGEVRNPHPEQPVPLKVRASARPAAVLVAVTDEAQPVMILTRRQPQLRFGGHVCFAGGHLDEGDEGPVATALREAHEEIGLQHGDVTVLGQLPVYFTQTGYRIDPVVALVAAGAPLAEETAEVAEILRVPLAAALDPASYRMTRFEGAGTRRGHIAYERDGVRVSGPTVSLMIGLLERLGAWSGGNHLATSQPRGSQR